ncbi:MAG: flagellar filament capping protein FliD, partial [Rickettsiales bacterium]|nr:flagellar filament capping protein FliD [Rickettsiales bacterium]
NNADLTIFKQGNNLTVSNLTLDIAPAGLPPVFNATYNTGGGPTTVALTVSPITGSVAGYKLTGPAGSAIEGLEMLYVNTTAATINVTLTQGIGAKLFNTVDAALTSNTGSLAVEVKSINDTSDRLKEEIKNINKQVDNKQEQLLAKFSALESAISRVNSLLSSLEANDQQRYAAGA